MPTGVGELHRIEADPGQEGKEKTGIEGE